MIAPNRASQLPDDQRIVITGIGLTAPNGNDWGSFRDALLEKRSGVQPYEIRYFGSTLAGICDFETTRYQKKKEVRRGTRAGSVGVYAANEAISHAGIDWDNTDKSRVGIYIGVTEHGNVETENEIYVIKGFDYDTSCWSHHHNPRTVANNPAGENCAEHGHHRFRTTRSERRVRRAMRESSKALRCCGSTSGDVAIAGGTSESIHTFGIFASFNSQNALASHEDPQQASRPFDVDRNGIVVAEGGCLYILGAAERCQGAGRGDLWRTGRLRDEYRRDRLCASQPGSPSRMCSSRLEAGRPGSRPDRHCQHARDRNLQWRRPRMRRAQSCVLGIARTFGSTTPRVTSAMRWGRLAPSSWLENLKAFRDGVVHPTINVDRLDPECELPGLVLNEPQESARVDYILNNSFGMLGIKLGRDHRFASDPPRPSARPHLRPLARSPFIDDAV